MKIPKEKYVKNQNLWYGRFYTWMIIYNLEKYAEFIINQIFFIRNANFFLRGYLDVELNMQHNKHAT